MEDEAASIADSTDEPLVSLSGGENPMLQSIHIEDEAASIADSTDEPLVSLSGGENPMLQNIHMEDEAASIADSTDEPLQRSTEALSSTVTAGESIQSEDDDVPPGLDVRTGPSSMVASHGDEELSGINSSEGVHRSDGVTSSFSKETRSEPPSDGVQPGAEDPDDVVNESCFGNRSVIVAPSPQDQCPSESPTFTSSFENVDSEIEAVDLSSPQVEPCSVDVAAPPSTDDISPESLKDDATCFPLHEASSISVSIFVSPDVTESDLSGAGCVNEDNAADLHSENGQSPESPTYESLDEASQKYLQDMTLDTHPSVVSKRGERDDVNGGLKQEEDLDKIEPEPVCSLSAAMQDEPLCTSSDDSHLVSPRTPLLSATDFEMALSEECLPPKPSGIIPLPERVVSDLIQQSVAERDLPLPVDGTHPGSPSNISLLAAQEPTIILSTDTDGALPESLHIASATDEAESELVSNSISLEERDVHDVTEPSVYELEPKRVIILISNGVPDRVQAKNQWRAMNLLDAKAVPYATVDAMNPIQRTRRNELFEISQVRNLYPQVFIEFSDGSVAFIGDWEFMEELNDASSLPKEMLDDNPQILTWEKMFSNVVESFED